MFVKKLMHMNLLHSYNQSGPSGELDQDSRLIWWLVDRFISVGIVAYMTQGVRVAAGGVGPVIFVRYLLA